MFLGRFCPSSTPTSVASPNQKLDMRYNYSMLVVPGYLGSKKVVDKWARMAHKNKTMLLTDYRHLDSVDSVVDLFESDDLSGGDGYCEQYVTIDATVDQFNPYTIKWPKHYDGSLFDGYNFECSPEDSVDTEPVLVLMGEPFTCMSGLVDNIPVWCDTECGLIGYSVESDTVVASDACLKIINRWTVVDWCTWDANNNRTDDENDQYRDSFVAIEDWTQGICTDCPKYGPEIQDSVYFRYDEVDVDGYYTFDQVIKVVDDSAPIVVLESETVVVNTSGGSDQKEGDRQCFGSDVITASAMDFCDGIESPAEFLQWNR